MDNADRLSLLRRAATAGSDPALDDDLRLAFADVSDEAGIALLMALEVPIFCAAAVRLAAILPHGRLPMVLPAFDNVANQARFQGRNKDALLAFQGKLAVHPGDSNCRFAIAGLLTQESRYAEAYEVLKPGIADIAYTPGWMLFAQLAMSVEDIEAAAPYVERLYRIDPSHAETRMLRKRVANYRGSLQLGMPDLDEKTVVQAANDVVQLAWPPNFGEALRGVAERPNAGPAARALFRLHQWVSGGERAEEGREDDARILMNCGAEGFVAAALAHAPQDPDGRVPEWADRARRCAEAARDFDELSSGLSSCTTERGVAWHLRRLSALRQDIATYLAILTPARMAVIANVFHHCQDFHPALKVEARQLLVASAGAKGVLVEALQAALARLGHADQPLQQAYGSEIDNPPDVDDPKDRAIQQANRIVYFITWHDDPSSLVRLLTALYDELNFYFISVGGTHSSRKVDELLFLAQAPNVILFKGSPAAWGGRKILFENAFACIEFFLALKPGCRWLQMLCNQSFPLISQAEARRRLAGTNWSPELLGVAPPTALPAFYTVESRDFNAVHAPVHGVLRRADSRDLRFPEFLHYTRESFSINFSSRPQAMNRDFKVKGIAYAIKPYNVDIRTMGLARFIEISDIADESGTYSALLAPRHAQAVHSILRRYQLKTGDPFLLMSHGQAEFLMNDPVAHELYLAMANQFGPDMNYFDTVRENSPFRGEPSHLYFRPIRNDLTVEEADIDSAVGCGMFFTRKVRRPEGVQFAAYFGERIAAEKPEQARHWSVTLDGPPAPESHTVRSLLPWPTPEPWVFRDLNGRVLTQVTAFEDGRLINGDGGGYGHWRYDDDGSLLLVDVPGYPTLRFHRITAVDGKFILVPDSLVWVESDWGRFLEQPISADWTAGHAEDFPRIALDADALRRPEAILRQGKSALGVAIAGFSNVPDDPMVSIVRRETGICNAIGRAPDGTILARFNLGGGPAVLRLTRAVVAQGRQVFVFCRATASQQDQHIVEGGEIVLDPATLSAQSWWLRSRRFPNWRELRIAPSGQTSLEGCPGTGLARFKDGRLLLADMGDWAMCEFTQVAWTDEGWHLAGYGQYDLAEDDYMHLVSTRTGDRPV